MSKEQLSVDWLLGSYPRDFSNPSKDYHYISLVKLVKRQGTPYFIPELHYRGLDENDDWADLIKYFKEGDLTEEEGISTVCQWVHDKNF